MKKKSKALEVINTCLNSLTISSFIPQSFLQFKHWEGKSIQIIGVGKSAIPLVGSIRSYLVNKLGFSNQQLATPQIFTKKGYETLLDYEAKVYFGGHPHPSSDSLKSGKLLKELIQKIGTEDGLIFCLTGGASAIVEDLEEGISIEDLKGLNSQLLYSTASIQEVNTLRGVFSTIKNGGLLRSLKTSFFQELIISDIPGDQVEFVGSGPFHHREFNKEEIEGLVNKYLRDGVKEKLLSEIVSSGFKQKKKQLQIEAANNFQEPFVMADYEKASDLLKGKLKQTFNLSVHFIPNAFNCSMEDGMKILLEEFSQWKENACLLGSGGELTVDVQGEGKGGRNTHFVLAMGELIFEKNVLELSRSELERFFICSWGVDGTDGDTNAAGGVMTYLHYEKAKELGLDFREFLNNFDSYHFLQKVDGLLVTGPQELNLMDIRLMGIL